MGRYQHITIWECEEIMARLTRGEGVRQIARFLGRSPSTVSRERLGTGADTVAGRQGGPCSVALVDRA